MCGGTIPVDSPGEVGDGVPVVGEVGEVGDAEGRSGDDGVSSARDVRDEFHGEVFPFPLVTRFALDDGMVDFELELRR